MLQSGDAAPAVSARNQYGETVDVDVREPTVLYFYPRDDTPGCTLEAEQFGREYGTYRDAGVAVYGISTDDVDAHAAFAEKRDIQFDLLADPDGDIAEAYGVAVEDGRADRATFVVADSEVKRVYEDVDPDGHARTVLGDMLDDGLVILG